MTKDEQTVDALATRERVLGVLSLSDERDYAGSLMLTHSKTQSTR